MVRVAIQVSFVVGLGFLGASTGGCSEPSDPIPRRTAVSAPERPTSSFVLDGALRVSVPSHLVEVDGAEQEAIQASLGIVDSDQLDFAVRRDGSTGTLVTLQRERTPLVARGGEVVGTYLDELLDAMMGRDGVTRSDHRVRTNEQEGIRRRCVDAIRGRGRRVWSCVAAHIEPSSRMVVIDVASCLGTDAALCEAVMGSFDVTGTSMASQAVLEATTTPGLEGVAGNHFAWIQIGASRDEFHAACRAAGQRVEDDQVLAQAPPAVQHEIRSGRLSVCGGGPWDSSLGPVRTVHAVFDEAGVLLQASLFVLRSSDEVDALVQSAYPDHVREQGMTVYFVNRDAVGREVTALFVSPSVSSPGQTLVQVMGRPGQ